MTAWGEKYFFPPTPQVLPTTSSGGTQDVESIVKAYHNLRVAPPLEFRGCLELMNLSVPLQGMKNNLIAKTWTCSCGKI